MLLHTRFELPSRTANIFCSTTAGEGVHEHVLTVDWQFVLQAETEQRSGCEPRLEGSRWERVLKRIVKASIQRICNVITFKGQTDVDRFPLSLLDHIRFELCCHVLLDETLGITILSEYTNDMGKLIVDGVWRAD